MFVARQVVEHLLDLENFLACAEIVLKPDGMIFISVPDVESGLRQGDLSLVWEEHVNYFTEPVLVDLLRRHGLAPLSIKKYDFSGGCLSVLARRGGTVAADTQSPAAILSIAANGPNG